MAHALGTEDYQRIDAAVTSVERRTAAEFAVVTTRVSDRYSLYPLVWAQFAALMVTGIAALVWPRLGIRAAVLIQVPVVIALWLLFHWLPVRPASAGAQAGQACVCPATCAARVQRPCRTRFASEPHSALRVTC